jgi:hypothetical protein
VTGKFKTWWVWTAASAAVLSACDATIVEPNLRFGQSGQLVVEVLTPRPAFPTQSPVSAPFPASVEGELRQILTWRSNGAWQLFESIAYRGELGSEATTRSPGIPGAFASAFASVITHINGTGPLGLFIDVLDPGLNPDCDADDQARVTLWIQDEMRRVERSWTRCSRGPLGSLNPSGSGPDLHASRVINVSKLIHDYTLGDSTTSAFHESIPFATLDKGAKPGELEVAPRVFFGGPGADDEPGDWRGFWGWHAGRAPPPDIDWSTDMVVFAGDGARYEAGNTVEIRQIVPVLDGAFVRLVELVPGDFCSPAAVVQTPYHMVVAPRTLQHVQFADLTEERVPCGL